MVELFGRSWPRTAIAERTGALAQLAGVELLEYADGPERGVRVLEFRTGAGLGFRVAVDRGFDLLAAEYRGIPIGWRSPTGPRHPALASPEESRGWGFLRSFTGLLATCGLDHALAPATSSAAHYIYPGIGRDRLPAARPGLADPGAPARLRRALGGRRLHAVRRGRGRADGGVRREPRPDPQDRGGARRHQHQRDRPGREPRLPADPAHAALPLQLRFPAARRGRRAAAAEPRDRPYGARGPARPGRRLPDPGPAGGRLPRAGLPARRGRRGRRHGARGADQSSARRRRLRRPARLRPRRPALPDRVAVPAIRALRARHRALDQPRARAQLRRAARRADVPASTARPGTTARGCRSSTAPKRSPRRAARSRRCTRRPPTSRRPPETSPSSEAAHERDPLRRQPPCSGRRGAGLGRSPPGAVVDRRQEPAPVPLRSGDRRQSRVRHARADRLRRAARRTAA